MFIIPESACGEKAGCKSVTYVIITANTSKFILYLYYHTVIMLLRSSSFEYYLFLVTLCLIRSWPSRIM